MTRILIIGASISGQLAAAFLRKKNPGLEVTVVGPRENSRPIVGESLIEPSTSFIRELGLGHLLVDRHLPKYGLTYYYKRNFSDPEDRAYVVEESPFVLPFLSFNLNRFTFDEDLAAFNEEQGVKRIYGKVKEVRIVKGASNEALIEQEDGSTGWEEADWLVDASGRSRLLARQLDLHQDAKVQRSSFWLRLSGFDRDFLQHFETIKRKNVYFDSFYCTHHFFGRGNWIWAIPMRARDETPLLSMGIAYRPDLYEGRISTLDEFRDRVGKEHPLIVDLLDSGEVQDTNKYFDYMYRCKQHYSVDGWAIIGDAGDSVDPLYSMGLTFTSLQIRQLSAAIAQQEEGREISSFLTRLDSAYTNYHRSVTDEITRLYEVMDDSYQCHLRQHLAQYLAFNAGFPLIMSGYLNDPVGAWLIEKLFDPEVVSMRSGELNALLEKSADRRPDPYATDDFLPVNSSEGTNLDFFCSLNEETIPSGLARSLVYSARFRISMLDKLGWRGMLQSRHQLAAATDLLMAAGVRTVFGGSKLREHALMRKFAKFVEI